MIDFKHLKKTQRIHTDDKRNFKLGLRADRNEKVVDWPPNIFKKIFTKSLLRLSISRSNSTFLRDSTN